MSWALNWGAQDDASDANENGATICIVVCLCGHDKIMFSYVGACDMNIP